MIKGEASSEPADGLFPGFSASGQDVWLSKASHQGPGLVLSAVGARCGKVFEASGKWGVVANTAVLIPQPGYDPHFLWYLVNNEDFWEKGGTAQPYVRIPETLNQRLSFPTLQNQQAIANFLDAETARIDVLVNKKQQMVELLDERRRALRDDTFDVKPGWRLKHLLAEFMAYGVLVPEFVPPGTGVPMIRTYNLSPRGGVNHDDIAEIPAALANEYRRTSLREGNVILSVVGSMGRSAVVTSDEEGYNLNRPLARLQPRPELPSRLLWHWTQTTRFIDMARLATGGGTAQPTLNLGDLANFTVELPREKELWPELLELLEKACGQLDAIEDQLTLQLALLQERRQALITAAVSGNL